MAEIKKSPGKLAEWACEKCTFENHPDHLQCKLCGSNRPILMTEQVEKILKMQICDDPEIVRLTLEECEGDMSEAVRRLTKAQPSSSGVLRKKKRMRIPRKSIGVESDSSRNLQSVGPTPERVKKTVSRITNVTGVQDSALIHRLLMKHDHDQEQVTNLILDQGESRLRVQLEQQDRQTMERKRLKTQKDKLQKLSQLQGKSSEARATDRQKRARRRLEETKKIRETAETREAAVKKKRRRLRRIAERADDKVMDDAVVGKHERGEESEPIPVVDDDEPEPMAPVLDEEDEGIEEILSETEESDEYEDVEEKSYEKIIHRVVVRCKELSENISKGIKRELKGPVEQEKGDIDDERAGEAFVQSDGIRKLGPYVLKEFQIKGVRWLYRLFKMGLNGVLADEMGLGKTIQTIGLIRLIHKYHETGQPTLIVAPTSVLDNWMRELRTLVPEVNSVKYTGSQAERAQLQADLLDPNDGKTPLFNVLVTSYSYFQTDSAKEDRRWLRKRKFRYMILDEGHSIKNMRGRRFENLSNLKAKNKLILSGTPIQNNMQELLALLAFLMPGIFGRDELEALEILSKSSDTEAEGGISVFRELLNPFCLRRVKTHVLKEMSPKKDVTLKLNLGERQREAYQRVIEVYKSNFRRKQKHIFTELRKAANHPLLLRQRYTDEIVKEVARLLIQSPHLNAQCSDPFVRAVEEMHKMSDFNIHCWCLQESIAVPKLLEYTLTSKRFNANLTHSAKFDELRRRIPELVKQDHRVLLFSQWTSLLDIMEILMEELELNYLRLDGSTPANERQILVDRYNTDKKYNVFLLSTKSGGVGLNLTSADTVILHDLDFNPQNDLQAENRCHRIGQKKEVTVIRLVSANTVDERIFQIACKKQVLNEAVLNPKEKSQKVVTADLLADVFKTKS